MFYVALLKYPNNSNHQIINYCPPRTGYTKQMSSNFCDSILSAIVKVHLPCGADNVGAISRRPVDAGQNKKLCIPVKKLLSSFVSSTGDCFSSPLSNRIFFGNHINYRWFRGFNFSVYLPKTLFKRSVDRAPGFTLIIFSCCPSIKKRPPVAFLVT